MRRYAFPCLAAIWASLFVFTLFQFRAAYFWPILAVCAALAWWPVRRLRQSGKLEILLASRQVRQARRAAWIGMLLALLINLASFIRNSILFDRLLRSMNLQ